MIETLFASAKHGLSSLSLPDWLGIGGFGLACLALFLNWRQHAYTKSKDKSKFVAYAKFKSWSEPDYSKPLDPDLRRREQKQVGRIEVAVGNRGPDCILEGMIVESYMLWRLLGQKRSCRFWYQGAAKIRDEFLKGDKQELSVVVEEGERFYSSASVILKTADQRKHRIRIKGFKKARDQAYQFLEDQKKKESIGSGEE